MKTINTLDPKPFRRLCMTIGELPSSYLDSMTYYEMVAWLCEYIKKNVVTAINDHALAIKEIQDWIETLDLQDEVDDKIDRMKESGELAEIITQYLEVHGILSFDSVADMKAAENLIDGSFVETYGFYAAGDGGGAKYKVREVINTDVVDEKKLISLNNENLVAELTSKKEINVKQIGAYGNGDNDDAETIQYAINNFDSIYFPIGTYKITDEILLDSQKHIYGEGEKSVISLQYTYAGTTKYALKWNSNNYLYRTIIEKLKFATNDRLNYAGGIYIESALRGNIIRDVWFEDLACPIKLGDGIHGLFSIKNIYAYLFPSEDNFDITKATGIYIGSNAVYCSNCEIIGKFQTGVHFYSAGTGCLRDSNISGSEQIYMNTAVKIEDSHNIDVNEVYIEGCVDSEGSVNTKAINVINSDHCSINNINLASGSVWVNGGSNNSVYGVKYSTNTSGIRLSNGAKVDLDKSSCGYCNYQQNNNYMGGFSNVINVNNDSTVNLKENPTISQSSSAGWTRTNASVTVSDNTTDMLTSDRCLNVVSTDYQGVTYTFAGGVIGRRYTVVANVKTVSNIDWLYFTSTNSSVVSDFPCVVAKAADGYQMIRFTFTVTSANPTIRIISRVSQGQSTGTFILDSAAIYCGNHDSTLGVSTD